MGLIDRDAALVSSTEEASGLAEVIVHGQRGETMGELKPCPFCGGKAKLIQKAHGSQNSPTRIRNSYVVGCEKCNIFTKYYQSDIWQGEDGVVNIDANGAVDAIEAWNRRANEQSD